MNEPIRVTMLVRNPYTHDSRVEKEARTLREAGYSVTVVAEAAAGVPASEQRDGIEIRRVPRAGPAVPGLRFARHQARLAAAIEATGPRILHAHDSDALGPVWWVARRRRIPFVYDAHELWLGRPPRDRSVGYALAFRAYYRLLEERLLPRAAAWITVSPPIARHLERRYRIGPVELVPNYPELPASVTPRPLRELPGGDRIPARAPTLLHLGGYTPERGIDELIAALGGLPEPHLVLLGADASAERIAGVARRHGVDERVHVLPAVPPGAVVDYAASATIGVAPIIPTSLNNAYSLPNKLFQYMAAGIPVVASALPQMRDVVEGSGAGVVVDSRDPAAIAAAVGRLLDAPGRLAEMGASARRAVEERYHWGVAAGTLLAVHERLTPGP